MGVGGSFETVFLKQPVLIPPQLRGLVSFSHSLYTLHLYDKKTKQNKKYDKFSQSNQQLSTPAEDFSFLFFHVEIDVFAVLSENPFGASVPISDCEDLCLHVRLHTCQRLLDQLLLLIRLSALHKHTKFVGRRTTTKKTKKKKQTETKGAVAVPPPNASSCSNGTILDYISQE